MQPTPHATALMSNSRHFIEPASMVSSALSLCHPHSHSLSVFFCHWLLSAAVCLATLSQIIYTRDLPLPAAAGPSHANAVQMYQACTET
jgi:hypothetical protein